MSLKVATVAGPLDLTGGKFRNPEGDAISADRATVFILAGWVLTTAIVAALTGLVRRGD